MSDVVWDEQAMAALLDLADRNIRQSKRIAAAAYRYADARVGDVKKLRGEDNLWRLRVGDWRVVFAQEGTRMRITEVVNRRDAYD